MAILTPSLRNKYIDIQNPQVSKQCLDDVSDVQHGDHREGCGILAVLCCVCEPKSKPRQLNRNFRELPKKLHHDFFLFSPPFKNIIDITLNLVNNADRLMGSISEIRLQLMKIF